MNDTHKYQWLLKNLRRHGEQTWAVHLTAPDKPWIVDESGLDGLIIREIMREAKKAIVTEESV